MARFTFKLPDIGEGTAEAEISQWRVKVGDTVREDDPLVDMLTDKATVELTSPVDGTVIEIAGEAGSMVPVGSPLVILETSAASDIGATPAPQADGPAIAEAADAPHQIGPGGGTVIAAHSTVRAHTPPPPRAEPPPEEERHGPAHRDGRASPLPAAAQPPSPPGGEGRPLAAPAVRARAKALGVDLRFVQPGPHGRIRHQELDAFLAYGQPAPASAEHALPQSGEGQARQRQGEGSALSTREGSEQQRMIGLRRKIAEKMAQSKRSIPHFAYVEEIDCTELEALRRHLNDKHGAARGKLTLLPFLIRAITRAAPEFPMVNARYDEAAGVIERFAPVHLGLAAQTPNGLMVPVIFNAEARSLWDLAAEIARLSNAARAGKASARELSGSTITLTSLGALGGIVTTPVINHPEVAIVGVGKLEDRAVVSHGQIVVRKRMNLSSSFDHRVVDGYDAALFVQALKAQLEHPATLFLDE
ncbi:MAG: dihydrolipoamide acetyltransferase family protein [Sphingomonadaceae bacterium]|nr:dihydrolipoamide acetyltransferase family protein [Sphingomonadaceae bacterium]